MHPADSLHFSPSEGLNVRMIQLSALIRPVQRLLREITNLQIIAGIISASIAVTAARYYWGDERFGEFARMIGGKSVILPQLRDVRPELRPRKGLSEKVSVLATKLYNDFSGTVRAGLGKVYRKSIGSLLNVCEAVYRTLKRIWVFGGRLRRNIRATSWPSRSDIFEAGLDFVKWVVATILIGIPVAVGALYAGSLPPIFLNRRLLAILAGIIASKPSADFAVSVFTWIDLVEAFFREVRRERNQVKQDGTQKK